MTDRYADHNSSLTSPAAGAFAVVPHDTDPVPNVTRAIYVGLGGALSVEMQWGGTVTFVNVPDGSLLPLRVRRVLTSSTAASLIGLY